MELARQLRAKREERGLSQDEVSKAIFVSRQTISNWENDKTYPDVQSLLLLSQLFEVSIDALVRGDVVAMQRAIAEDSRKMRLLSIGMLVFSGLAFLFLLKAFYDFVKIRFVADIIPYQDGIFIIRKKMGFLESE